MSTKKVLSLICALSWFFQAVLHLLILFGAPLGRLFFGGAYRVFPLWLRPANLALVLLWSTISYAYLVYGEFVKNNWSDACARWILGLTTVFLAIATFFNVFISTSPWEKYLTGSLTALTFLLSLCLVFLPSKNEP